MSNLYEQKILAEISYSLEAHLEAIKHEVNSDPGGYVAEVYGLLDAAESLIDDEILPNLRGSNETNK